MSTLAEIEAAAQSLPEPEKEQLFFSLAAHLHSARFSAADIAEIQGALTEAEAEFERGEGVSTAEMRRHFGIH
jgi:hypothetical protein